MCGLPPLEGFIPWQTARFTDLDWNPQRNSYAAINYMLFFACFSVVVHSISIWLTVTLAVFR